MKLPGFLYLLTLVLLAVKAFGLLAVPWFLVFAPALMAFGLGVALFLVAVVTVMAAQKNDAPLGGLAKR